MKKKKNSKPSATSRRPKADQSIAEVGNKLTDFQGPKNIKGNNQVVKNRKTELYENEQVDSGSSEIDIVKGKLSDRARNIPPHKNNVSSHLEHPQLKSNNKLSKQSAPFRMV